MVQQLGESIKAKAISCKAEDLIDFIDKYRPSLIVSAGSDYFDEEQLQELYYTLENAGQSGIEFMHFDCQTAVRNWTMEWQSSSSTLSWKLKLRML